MPTDASAPKPENYYVNNLTFFERKYYKSMKRKSASFKQNCGAQALSYLDLADPARLAVSHLTQFWAQVRGLRPAPLQPKLFIGII
jgi:hypothetical protein